MLFSQPEENQDDLQPTAAITFLPSEYLTKGLKSKFRFEIGAVTILFVI